MTCDQAEEVAKPVLKCPLCGGTEFDPERGRLGRLRLEAHRILSCGCRLSRSSN